MLNKDLKWHPACSKYPYEGGRIMRPNNLIYALMGVLAAQWTISHVGSLEHSFDLMSVAPKHHQVGRSTELGKAIPSETNNKKEVEVILKDPALSKKWGLQMTQAQKAWRLTQGSRKIVVAIIDTGVDTHHPDLIHNLWTNPGESGVDQAGHRKENNGIDDDQNGFVDDVHGWNFVNNSNDLTDTHGHGTHIAGIIGAEGGNGIGISGVSPKVSLMILKYYDPHAENSNNLINTVRAIRYATKMNARIINYSGGGLSPSAEERAAVAAANKKGILFVAAAGNERSDSDVKGYYPADYGLPNIVSVTAIDRTKNVLPSSNWGTRTVQIAAPGNDIYSTLPGGKYGYMTGTSQATAFVSGVAALVMANNPNLKHADQVIKYLTRTGDIDQRLAGKTRFERRLNTYKALAIQDLDLNFNGTQASDTPRAHRFSSDPAAQKQAEAQAFGPEGQIADFGRKIKDYLDTSAPTPRPDLKSARRM